MSVDVRVISATNKDLRREMEKGTFREDLYYRLNVVPMRIPALRERKNDIPLLASHFLKLAAKGGKKPATLSREALSLLMDYSWPGNVRELQNAIHFGLVKSRSGSIHPEHLPFELRKMTCIPSKPGPECRLARGAVTEALAQTGGNVTAAKISRVGRATLYRFLAKKRMSRIGDAGCELRVSVGC